MNNLFFPELKNIEDFLDEDISYKTVKGSSDTNLINRKGKHQTFNIPPEKWPTLFELMNKARKNSNLNIHFLERQLPMSGIVIDIDIYQKNQERQLNPTIYMGLINYVIHTLNNIIDFSNCNEYLPLSKKTTEHQNNDMKFCVFITEKPEVVADGDRFKDGFHLLIPEIMVSRAVKIYLIEKLISEGIIQKVFKNFKNIVGSCDDMLDKMSSSFPVMFLGNSKIKDGKSKPPYILKHGYYVNYDIKAGMPMISAIPQHQIDSETISSEYFIKSYDKLLSHIPINLVYELSLSYYLENMKFDKQYISTWLRKCQYFAHKHLEIEIKLTSEKTQKFILNQEEIKENENSVVMLTMNDYGALFLHSLLCILDDSFTTDYNKWFKVICAVANEGTQYKDLAINFSHRNPQKWDPNAFEDKWREAENWTQKSKETYTIRSLMQWAKECDPEKYNDSLSKNYASIIHSDAYSNIGDIQHFSVAKILMDIFLDKFVVVSHKRDFIWYEFVLPNKNMKKGQAYKWAVRDNPYYVDTYMSVELYSIYLGVADTIRNEKNKTTEKELRKWLNTLDKSFRKNIRKLLNNAFKKCVINEFGKLLVDKYPNFTNDLDSYPNIIGVGNGILICGPNPKLIKGFHEYRISRYTATDYEPYNRDNVYIDTLMKTFEDIYPEPDALRFILCFISTCLDISNQNIYLLQLVGFGANGKTTILQFTKEALGDYAYKAPVTILSDDREKSQNANPALMEFRGRRFIFYSEPQENTVVQEGKMKEILSPEDISARELYGKQVNFKIRGTHIVASNKNLRIKSVDNGIWRRMIYYYHKRSFKDDPNPENPLEKKLDERITNEYMQDDNFRRAMLSILVHYNQVFHKIYNNNLGNLLKHSPTILRETETYRNEQDSFNNFISHMIVSSPGYGKIYIEDIANKFNEWNNMQNMAKKMPIKDVINNLQQSKLNKIIHNEQISPIVVKYYIKDHRILENINEEIKEPEKYVDLLSINKVFKVEKYVDIYDRISFKENTNEIIRKVDNDLQECEDNIKLTSTRKITQVKKNAKKDMIQEVLKFKTIPEEIKNNLEIDQEELLGDDLILANARADEESDTKSDTKSESESEESESEPEPEESESESDSEDSVDAIIAEICGETE